MTTSVKILVLCGTAVSIPLLVCLFLLGSSNVYVSGGLAADFFEDNTNPIWQALQAVDSRWLPRPGVISVQYVGVLHMARNALFIFCTAGLLALLPILSLVIGVCLTLYGLFTASWDMFGIGLLMTFIMTPLAIIVVVLGTFVLWLVLLIQPGTPAYIILWILVGLPFAALGAVGGAAPTITVIVIVKE